MLPGSIIALSPALCPVCQVINTVTAIVKHLPPDVFDISPPSPTAISSHDSLSSLAGEATALTPANAQESARNNIIREMVETERKYVQDLEVMQVLPMLQMLLRSRLHFFAEIFYSLVPSQHH